LLLEVKELNKPKFKNKNRLFYKLNVPCLCRIKFISGQKQKITYTNRMKIFKEHNLTYIILYDIKAEND